MYKNGSLATVYSHDGRYIGKGYINHASKILVRIFIRGGEQDDKQLYLQRIKAADDYRRSLGYESCYRMVFAEADDLPALIIDATISGTISSKPASSSLKNGARTLSIL